MKSHVLTGRGPGRDSLYVIGTRDSGDPVKIGRSSDVERRLARLQTGNPNPLEALLVLPGWGGEEPRVHRLFSEDRVRGEWFARSFAVRRWIALCRLGVAGLAQIEWYVSRRNCGDPAIDSLSAERARVWLRELGSADVADAPSGVFCPMARAALRDPACWYDDPEMPPWCAPWSVGDHARAFLAVDRDPWDSRSYLLIAQPYASEARRTIDAAEHHARSLGDGFRVISGAHLSFHYPLASEGQHTHTTLIAVAHESLFVRLDGLFSHLRRAT